MIKLENFSFSYPGASFKSLDAINLLVQPGECVILAEQSGCGKTTLTRVLNGLCPKFYGGKPEGRYLLEGKDSNTISLDEIDLVLGSVFQDPRSQFFAKHVRDEIVLGMENHGTERRLMRERLWEVSEGLGITRLFEREMATLSSGEKQKVAIASVYALRPKGLVLDEPSANLDFASTVHLTEFLRSLKHEGHAIVVSEHRLCYLKDIFDRLIIMEGGRIVKEYNRAQALELTETELREMGLRYFHTAPLRVAERIRDYAGCCARARDVSLRLNDTQILNGVQLGFARGQVTAITGSNGSGKAIL
jgi:energy-coupling factor transport system ATP-binding protein